MGLFKWRRHRLQNQANRAIIADRREKVAARRQQQAEAEVQQRIEVATWTKLGPAFAILDQTQQQRVRELEDSADRHTQRGEHEHAAACRKSAANVRAMTPDEFNEDRKARFTAAAQ